MPWDKTLLLRTCIHSTASISGGRAETWHTSLLDPRAQAPTHDKVLMSIMYEELVDISVLLDASPISKTHNSFFPSSHNLSFNHLTHFQLSKLKYFQLRSPLQTLSRLLLSTAHSPFPFGYLVGFSNFTCLKHNSSLHPLFHLLLPLPSQLCKWALLVTKLFPVRNPRIILDSFLFPQPHIQSS